MVSQIIAIIGLFLGILLTISIIAKAVAKQVVGGGMIIICALGWTVFIAAMYII